MDTFTLAHAKEHLEELMERARRGEDVRIADERGAAVKLTPERPPDPTVARVTDTMEPFVPLKRPRVPGRLTGKLAPPPDGFFDPLTDAELKDWYGEDA